MSAVLKRCGRLALLACWLGAGAAEATPVLDLVFTATSGTGTPGSSSIAAAPGDLLTLELRLGADAAGVSSYAVSIEFDRDLRDELDLVSVEEVLPVGFAFAFTPGELAQATDSNVAQRGRLYTFEAATLGLGPVSRTLTIGRIEFRAGEVLSDGVDLEIGFFNTGVDGLFDNAGRDVAGEASLGTAMLEAVPEPALVVLWLVGLGAAWGVSSVRR